MKGNLGKPQQVEKVVFIYKANLYFASHLYKSCLRYQQTIGILISMYKYLNTSKSFYFTYKSETPYFCYYLLINIEKWCQRDDFLKQPSYQQLLHTCVTEAGPSLFSSQLNNQQENAVFLPPCLPCSGCICHSSTTVKNGVPVCDYALQNLLWLFHQPAYFYLWG